MGLVRDRKKGVPQSIIYGDGRLDDGPDHSSCFRLEASGFEEYVEPGNGWVRWLGTMEP